MIPVKTETTNAVFVADGCEDLPRRFETMKRTPHMCITCKHYEPYRCILNDGYIGYIDCDKPTKCRAWRLHDNYKKGGKFHKEERSRNDIT